MKSIFAVLATAALLILAVGFGAARQAPPLGDGPVELAILTDVTWDRFVPQGKEIDAIYGDIVLRNSYLSAVIAQPLATRHANMTVRDVAGSIIDLTTQRTPSDQLAAFYPGKRSFPYRSAVALDAVGGEVAMNQPVTSTKPASVAVKADGKKPADRLGTAGARGAKGGNSAGTTKSLPTGANRGEHSVRI